MSHASQTEKEFNGFFSLSAELRNRIYEAVLVSQAPIPISPDLKEPSLLLTCRQIRTEAIGLYYRLNIFQITIYNLDASLHGAFNQHVTRYENTEKSELVPVKTLYAGTPHWGNLIKWSRQMWLKRDYGIWPDPTHGPMQSVVAAASEMVNAYVHLDWEKCEKALFALRVVAGHVDKEWLKDHNDEEPAVAAET